MSTSNPNNKLVRMLTILALMFVFTGLLDPAPAATAEVVREVTTRLPATPSVTPATSVPIGKLGVYLTDYFRPGEPLVGWPLYVSDLSYHEVAEGQTNSSGYYAVLLPPGEYIVDSGAWPSRCVGFFADVTIVANQTTTVRGEAGCRPWY